MNVTAVTVVYNTPKLILNCVVAFRLHYPNIPLLIIDGSSSVSECARVVNILQKKYKNITVYRPGYNIGHGAGLHLGISMAKTNNVLIFDSDTEIKKHCISKMLLHLDESTYGVGQVVKVNSSGYNDDNGFDYLHPHFAIINKKQYVRYPAVRNHGAPMILPMLKLRTLKKKAIVNFNVSEYVYHHERGTVSILKRVKR